MTQEQIKIIDQIEDLGKRGYLVEPRWAFAGYKCVVWELHNEHDGDFEIKPPNGEFRFDSKWDAYKAAIKYINKRCPYETEAFS